MEFKNIERTLNEFKTELYIPKGKKYLNINYKNTLINNNQVSVLPEEWRKVVKEVIIRITNNGWANRFSKDDNKNMDIIALKPNGIIDIVDDYGKKYKYNINTKVLKEV